LCVLSAEKDALLTHDARQQIDSGSATKGIAELYEESDAEHVIERMMYVDFCSKIPEHLLMLVDRMGMVNSLEVRSPLLDKELVEYMASFPLDVKIRRGKSRYAQRKLASGCYH
jgi:asparagine synthase (glutamine-hydrolysing)